MSELTTAMSNRDQYLRNFWGLCGMYFRTVHQRQRGEHLPIDFHLANGWELPYGANSLTLPSCSHVTANGLLQEPQTWGPEKAQTYLEWGQHRIRGKWYSTVPHSPDWNQTEAWSGAVNVSATTHRPAPTFLFQPPLTLWLHSNHTCITAAGLHMFPPTKGPLNMLFPAPGILSPSLFVQCPRFIHRDSSLTSVSLGSLPWLSKPW